MEPIKKILWCWARDRADTPAAFYAADLGKKVVLIDRDKRLGGVCLNRGCIPSKALLYATHQITASRESEHRGITFATPTVDLSKLRAWKESILTKLSNGVAQLASCATCRSSRAAVILKARNRCGWRRIRGSSSLNLRRRSSRSVRCRRCPRRLTSAIRARDDFYRGARDRRRAGKPARRRRRIHRHGNGTVYAALGSKIVLVEAMDSLLAGADADLARPVLLNAKKAFKEIRVKTKVARCLRSASRSK